MDAALALRHYMRELTLRHLSMAINGCLLTLFPCTQALFRKASAFLLAATKGKFYFKEVIISVPSSWPPMGRKKVWEDLFNQADVQVVSGLKEPDTLNPSRSFPGDFNPVRFPSEFVRDLNSTTTKKFGKPGERLSRAKNAGCH